MEGGGRFRGAFRGHNALVNTQFDILCRRCAAHMFRLSPEFCRIVGRNGERRCGVSL